MGFVPFPITEHPHVSHCVEVWVSKVDPVRALHCHRGGGGDNGAILLYSSSYRGQQMCSIISVWPSAHSWEVETEDSGEDLPGVVGLNHFCLSLAPPVFFFFISFDASSVLPLKDSWEYILETSSQWLYSTRRWEAVKVSRFQHQSLFLHSWRRIQSGHNSRVSSWEFNWSKQTSKSTLFRTDQALER